MRKYLDLMARVLENGEDQFNTRTGEMCRVMVGEQIQFDTREGFHAPTTKKLAFMGVRGELLGFFRGYTNAADFRALKCQVWNDNANVTPAWLANPYRKGTDDLGPIYGKQWTAWKDRRIADTSNERDRLLGLGYTVRMMSNYNATAPHYEWLMEREINQLEEALKKLLTNPSDRRIIVSGWNVAEIDMMALPPCHMDYTFVALDNPAGRDKPMVLHVDMHMRSNDMYLGLPFNMASTEMFLHIMARLAGMETGTVTIRMTNAHIYHNHFDKTKQQLEFEPMELPKLVLSENIKPVTLETIKGAFERIEMDDIKMEGYQFHVWDSSAPMAA